MERIPSVELPKVSPNPDSTAAVPEQNAAEPQAQPVHKPVSKPAAKAPAHKGTRR